MAKKLSIPLPDKLKKSLFWIVIGVLALVSLIVWWLGASAVAESRSSNIGVIDGYFATISGANPTANEDTVGKMQQQLSTRQKLLNEAWQRVYERQQKEPFWPEVELDPNGTVLKPGLPKQFVEAATSLPPPEWLYKPEPQLLREDLKEIYRNYARDQIQILCQIVNSQYRLGRRGSATPNTVAAERDAGDAAQPGEICVWPTASQQNAAELLTFGEGANPPTQDIIYAQESVWVYQSLFNIIKATNDSLKEATPPKDLAHYNAPVKFIHEISIGEKFVVKETNARTSSSSFGGAGPGEEAEIPIPRVLQTAARRYVNERGRRLKPEELLALENPNADHNPNVDPNIAHAQYKLMPVFMRLEVDQRYLGRLLVECANSPLTVEVKDVLFKVDGHADRASDSPQDAGPNSGSKETKNFYDVPVEITGHIYIYYPPQGAKSGDAGDEAPPTDEGAPADATAQAGG